MWVICVFWEYVTSRTSLGICCNLTLEENFKSYDICSRPGSIFFLKKSWICAYNYDLPCHYEHVVACASNTHCHRENCWLLWHLTFQKVNHTKQFQMVMNHFGVFLPKLDKKWVQKKQGQKKKKGTPIALECPCIWFFWIDVEKKSIFKEFCASVYEEKAALLQRHWLIQLFSSQKWNTTYPIIQLCSFMSSSVLLLVPMNPSSLLGKIKNAQSILHGYLSDKKLHFVW